MRKIEQNKGHSLIQAGISRSGLCHQAILPTLNIQSLSHLLCESDGKYFTFSKLQKLLWCVQRQLVLLYGFLSSNLKCYRARLLTVLTATVAMIYGEDGNKKKFVHEKNFFLYSTLNKNNNLFIPLYFSSSLPYLRKLHLPHQLLLEFNF